MKEEDVASRISSLEAEIETLEQEIRIAQGRLKNLDPSAEKSTREENKRLAARIEALVLATEHAALYLLGPKNKDDIDAELLSFKTSAIELFKKETIPPELWKNLES